MSAPRVSILPSLPAVPTAPMSVQERRDLTTALVSLKNRLCEPAVQDHVRAGYARVWLHLVLSKGLDPRKAVGPRIQGYQAILPAFLEAVERIGLHTKASASWWGVQVSQEASLLWRKATAAQGGAPQPLPGLGLDPISTVKPGWVQGLGSAAAADSRR